MKLRSLLLATTTLMLGATVAFAAGTQTIGVNAGLSSPTGDMSKAVGTGFYGGASYAYTFNGQFALGFDANYHMFGEKSTDTEILGFPITVKEKLNALQTTIFGKYFIPMKDAKIAPYVKAGVSQYRMAFKATVSGAGGSESQTDNQDKMGFLGGIGATMKLNDKGSVGAEALYHQIQTDNKSINMYTVGLSYYFKLGK